MEIYVKTLTGKTITVEIESWKTVRDLKEKIQDKEGTPLDEQRLIYRGRQLEDSFVLDQINVIQQTYRQFQFENSRLTVDLVRRQRGGGNGVFHRPLWSDQSSDSKSDELPRNGETKKSLAFKLSGGEMQVHIMDITGRQIPVEIAISDTVSGIKQKIFDKEGIDPNDQLFVFGGWHFTEGVVIDQINSILAKQPQLSELGESGPMPRRWYYFDELTGTTQATILMILRLKGGGNTTYHETQKTPNSSSASDSDCLDEQHIGDGGGNIVSRKVKVWSISAEPESSNPKDHLRNGKKKKNSGWSGYSRCK